MPEQLLLKSAVAFQEAQAARAAHASARALVVDSREALRVAEGGMTRARADRDRREREAASCLAASKRARDALAACKAECQAWVAAESESKTVVESVSEAWEACQTAGEAMMHACMHAVFGRGKATPRVPA